MLSAVPGLDAGAEARGDEGDIVVVAAVTAVVGAVRGREREPGCELGECGSCGIFRDEDIGDRMGEIVGGGGVEDSLVGISAILPFPNDTKEDPDGNLLVDISKRRPSRPLGTS